jgi:hypothetical protein
MTHPHPLFLATKKTQSPLDNGGVSDGDQIFSFTISNTLTIKWKLKKFSRPKGHGGMIFFKIDMTCAPPYLATEKF